MRRGTRTSARSSLIMKVRLAWNGLADSYKWIDRTKGIGGVYLTQILPFVDERALALYLGFERTVCATLDCAGQAA